MCKITIVVPIYNVEKYICKCLDSLVNQDFDDYQIYAINDGSPANEKAIIDQYVLSHPDKVISIEKSNGGYGSVLQLAIKKMESDYFLICDPDDYLQPDALSTLYDLAMNNQADLVVGAKTFIYNDDSEGDYDLSYSDDYVKLDNLPYVVKTKRFDDLFFIDPSPHSKLYKKSLVGDIMFPYKVGFTDNLLFYIGLLNADKVMYTNKSCSFYLVDRVGNTMTDIKPAIIDAHVLVFKEIIKQTNDLEYVTPIFYYRIFESYKFIFQQLRRLKCERKLFDEKEATIYDLLVDLKPYSKEINYYYSEFSKSKIIEKIKDRLSLTRISKFVFKFNFNKIKREVYVNKSRSQ